MSDSPSENVTPPVSPPSQRRKNEFRALWIVLPMVLFVLAAATLWAVFGPGPLNGAKTVVVPHGAGPHEVAKVLDDAGAIDNPWLFRVVERLLAENVMKAGEYELTAGISMVDIVKMIHEGRSVTRLFTVAEGLTSSEVARMINDEPTLGGDPVPVPPEGSLLPESYRYIYGDNRVGLVARMRKAMKDALDEQWAKREPTLPLTTPDQAVVMASIIEKETGKAVERPRIAGVFYNRLHHFMRLQSDPTVIYAIIQAEGALDHAIGHDDLSFASPYNTYMNDGLPPKPICNPGKASLEAALHPEHHDFLYFVASGTGGHVFAKTLDEHNQNVARWVQGRGK